jgi:molybdenum cofactor cytidylyltransferase
MGSPKALLQYRGETFLQRMHRLMSLCCDRVVIVLAPGTEAWAPVGASIVVNPDPDRGMLSSLQCGLSKAAADAVVFTPLDYPAIQESTIRAVVSSAGEIVIPRYGGKRGHPVRISNAVAQELLALPVETGTPADVIRRDAARIQYVEVDDPGIHRDIDLPSEYQELILQC